MFEEMKFAALSAKIKSGDPKSGKAADIFNAATVNAAEAFGFNAGIIAVGKDADALLIDLDAPEMIGDYNLVSNLVYAASNRVIDTVICSGKILMENGIVPGEKEIICAARKVCDKLRK